MEEAELGDPVQGMLNHVGFDNNSAVYQVIGGQVNIAAQEVMAHGIQNDNFNVHEQLQDNFDIADLDDIDLANYDMTGIMDEAQIDQAIADYIAQQNSGVVSDDDIQIYQAANNQPNNDGEEDGGRGGGSATYPADSTTEGKRKRTGSGGEGGWRPAQRARLN